MSFLGGSPQKSRSRRVDDSDIEGTLADLVSIMLEKQRRH